MYDDIMMHAAEHGQIVNITTAAVKMLRFPWMAYPAGNELDARFGTSVNVVMIGSCGADGDVALVLSFDTEMLDGFIADLQEAKTAEVISIDETSITVQTQHRIPPKPQDPNNTGESNAN